MEDEKQDYGLETLLDDNEVCTNEFDESQGVRRWILTINNPLWNDEKDVEYIANDKPFVEVDYSVLEQNYNKDIFDYKVIEQTKFNKLAQQFEKTGKLIRRPYFKTIESVYQYFVNLKENRRLEYAGFEYEYGEKDKTPHIQAFIKYDNNKRLINVKQDFPTAHIEKVISSTNAKPRDYCMKQGAYAHQVHLRIAGPWEVGIFIEERSRGIQEFQMAIESGASDYELLQKFPLATQYGMNKIEQFREVYIAQKFSNEGRNIIVTYIWGKSGRGKNERIFEKHGFQNCFRISNFDYPLTGYRQQKVVIVDEFDSQVKPITKFNEWIDRYPVQLNAKGTMRWACYDYFYILSNHPPSMMYRELQGTEKDEHYQSFIRRIHHVIHVDDKGIERKQKESFFDDIPPERQKFKGITREVVRAVAYDEVGKSSTIWQRQKFGQMDMVELTEEERDNLPW